MKMCCLPAKKVSLVKLNILGLAPYHIVPVSKTSFLVTVFLEILTLSSNLRPFPLS